MNKCCQSEDFPSVTTTKKGHYGSGKPENGKCCRQGAIIKDSTPHRCWTDVLCRGWWQRSSEMKHKPKGSIQTQCESSAHTRLSFLPERKCSVHKYLEFANWKNLCGFDLGGGRGFFRHCSLRPPPRVICCNVHSRQVKWAEATLNTQGGSVVGGVCSPAALLGHNSHLIVLFSCTPLTRKAPGSWLAAWESCRELPQETCVHVSVFALRVKKCMGTLSVFTVHTCFRLLQAEVCTDERGPTEEKGLMSNVHMHAQ